MRVGAKPAMDDLNDLFLYARVVEAGGFSAGERETGVPKSTLSRRVQALEERLGVRLIQRTPHRFQVTEVGEEVYRHARRMAEEAQAVWAAVGATLAEPSGQLRISASPLAGEVLLAGWLAEFVQRHPKLRISLEHDNRYVDLLGERYDLAIRYASQPLISADVVAKPIGRGRMALVASPDLLAGREGPAVIEDLHDLPALGQCQGDGIRPWVFVGPGGVPLQHHPRPRFVSDNLLVLREAALRGAGAIQLPLEACHDALADRRLVRLLPQVESTPTTAYAIYPSRMGRTAALKAVLAFLEDKFRELG